MNSLINKINKEVKNLNYFEFSLLSYFDNNLIFVGSEDFIYYHQIEIKFHDIFTIICNSRFQIDTSKDFLFELGDDNEQYELNIKYKVVQGNRIFKFISEDNQCFYIIAKDISFKKEVVKYY